MRTLQEVMEYCKHNVSQDEVNLLRQFFNDNYNGLDLDCAKSLIQSLSLSVSAQSSLQLAENMQVVVQIPATIL